MPLASQPYVDEEFAYLKDNLDRIRGGSEIVDTSVKQLSEAVALQIARVRRRFDASLAEIRQTLNDAADPSPYGVAPSRQILRVRPGPSEGRIATNLPRGSRFHPVRGDDKTDADLEIEFQTTRDLEIWPVELSGFTIDEEGLRFRIDLKHPKSNLGFADLVGFDRLVLFVGGGLADALPVHEALLRTRRATAGESGEFPITIRPVGLDDIEADPGSVHGLSGGAYAVSEFLLFPRGMLFLELSGLAAAAATAKRSIPVCLRLDGRPLRAERIVLKSNCVPTVNRVRVPILLHHDPHRDLHRLVPDSRREGRLEVVSIESVAEAGGRALRPLYAVQHTYQGVAPPLYWQAIRRPTPPGQEDVGSEVFLRLIDRGGGPVDPAGRRLELMLTCCHGNRPARKRFESWKEEGTGLAADLVGGPIPMLRPPVGEFGLKRSSQNLSALRDLRQLGGIGPEAGAKVIRALLLHRGRFDWETLPELTGALALERTAVEQLIGGLVAATAARDPEPDANGRPGRVVTVTLDGRAGSAGGGFLLGQGLSRLLADHDGFDAWSRVRVEYPPSDHVEEWPPRSEPGRETPS